MQIDNPPLEHPVQDPNTKRVTEPWHIWFQLFQQKLQRINNVTRISSGPYSLLDTDDVVFVDTDGGGITVNLPTGTQGDFYRIVNTGSSGNDITLTPDGTELLIGSNSNQTITDGNDLIISYDETEGWF